MLQSISITNIGIHLVSRDIRTKYLSYRILSNRAKLLNYYMHKSQVERVY